MHSSLLSTTPTSTITCFNFSALSVCHSSEMTVNVAPRVSSRPLSQLPYNSYYLLRSPAGSLPRRRLSRILRTSCCYTSLNNNNNNSFSADEFPRRQGIEDDFFTNFHASSSSSSSSSDFFFNNHTPSVVTSLPASSTTTAANQSRSRFRPSKLDLLEPSLLGIRTDPPERDEMIRFRIARRASCVELPLSLRIIKEEKKKNQQEQRQQLIPTTTEGGVEISTAFCTTVSVIRELHSHALRLRGLALDEEVGNKVESEMKSSFVWLFREVFSKTPDLMLDVMLLTVDFASVSVENNLADDGAQPFDPSSEGHEEIKDELPRRYPEVPPVSEDELTTKGREEEMDVDVETKQWNSMVEEASRIQVIAENIHHHEFLSPARVEIEDDDDYEEYHRTNLQYQMGILEEPNNALLLSNYAQFLYLVARDHDRAEECFQRAIQVDSSDPEIVSQYATFLWIVRKDPWGAEERYQQAMAAEPDNAYYASKYANFLWNTGGDDTCYPAADAPTNNK